HQSAENNPIATCLQHGDGLLVQRYGQYEIEQGVDVHQDTNGGGIDSVQCVQVQEQGNHREQYGDQGHDHIKRCVLRDALDQVRIQHHQTEKRDEDLRPEYNEPVEPLKTSLGDQVGRIGERRQQAKQEFRCRVKSDKHTTRGTQADS